MHGNYLNAWELSKTQVKGFASIEGFRNLWIKGFKDKITSIPQSLNS
jgi:hypothetical protein